MTTLRTTLLSVLLLCLLAVQAAGAGVVFGVVPTAESAGQGVVVQRVAEHTPAQQAGLQVGDVIVSVQGVPTPHAAALKSALRDFAPGDVLRVRYLRGGRQLTALVELAARPDRAAGAPAATRAELSPEMQQQFAQARSRLRIQLARLPHRMDRQQVHADLLELLVLARRVPTGCHGWLQGTDVQLNLRLDYPGGVVELHSRNGVLSLVVPCGSGSACYPINTPVERAALPSRLIRILQQF